MTELPKMATAEELPRDIIVDPNVALRSIAYAFHDFTCEEMKANGICTEVDRTVIPDSYDAVMPGLIAVANVATQMALLHLTIKFDLSPQEAIAYGVYSQVDWAALLPLLNCPVTKQLENGETVECQERGMHPEHRAVYMGMTVTWGDPPAVVDPETPEEAARIVQVDEAHTEALVEDEERKWAAYHAEQQRATEEWERQLAEEAEQQDPPS